MFVARRQQARFEACHSTLLATLPTVAPGQGPPDSLLCQDGAVCTPQLGDLAREDEQDGEAQQPGAVRHVSVQLSDEGRREQQPCHRANIVQNSATLKTTQSSLLICEGKLKLLFSAITMEGEDITRWTGAEEHHVQHDAVSLMPPALSCSSSSAPVSPQITLAWRKHDWAGLTWI